MALRLFIEATKLIDEPVGWLVVEFLSDLVRRVSPNRTFVESSPTVGRHINQANRSDVP